MPCPVGVSQIWNRNQKSDRTDCAFNTVPFIKTALPHLVAWEAPIPCNGTKSMNTQVFSVFPLPPAAKEGGVVSLLPPMPGGLLNFYYTWREQGKENICGWGGKGARERGKNSGKGRKRFVLKNLAAGSQETGCRIWGQKGELQKTGKEGFTALEKQRKEFGFYWKWFLVAGLCLLDWDPALRLDTGVMASQTAKPWGPIIMFPHSWTECDILLKTLTYMLYFSPEPVR